MYIVEGNTDTCVDMTKSEIDGRVEDLKDQV